MSTKQIVIKRKLSFKAALTAWVFLVLVPIQISKFTYDRLLDFTEKSNVNLSREELVLEMNAFQNEIKLKEFLNREIGNYFNNDQSKLSLRNAQGIVKDFEKRTKIRVAGIITHGEDTASIEGVYFSDILRKKIGRLPRIFTLKFFASLNNQPMRDFIRKKNNRNYVAAREAVDQKKLKADSDLFLQKTFSIIAPIPIHPEETAVSVSSKLGGFVYFYYKPFLADESKTDKSAIKGGCFLVILGKDISSTKLFVSSIKSVSPNIIRGFERRKKKLDDFEEIDLKELTQFRLDENGFHLLSPPPQNVIAHLAAEGQFYPKNINSLIAHLPLMKVTKPLKFIQHPLKKYSRLIELVSKLLILIGTLILLRAYFFGMDFNVRVRTKVLLGIAISAILPISLMLLSFSTLKELTKLSKKFEMDSYLRMKLDNIQKKLTTFIGKHQSGANLLSRRISTICFKDVTATEQMITEWLKNSFANEIILDLLNGKSRVFRNKDSKYYKSLAKDEEIYRNVVRKGLIDSLTCIDQYGLVQSANTDYDIFEETFLVKARFINTIMTSYGRLIELPQMFNLSSYSINPLVYPETGKIIGFLSFRYDRAKILNAFLENEVYKNAEIDKNVVYFLFNQREEPLKLVNIGKTKSFIPKEKLGLSCKIGKPVYWHDNGYNGKSYVVSLIPQFPLLVGIRQQNRKSFYGNDNYIAFFGFCYTIFLFILVFGIFGKVYITPINEFSISAMNIGAGDYHSSPDIRNKDEFFTLKEAFDEMAIGMAQKEKLSQFVSQDIISALANNDHHSLQPGGEKIEATVVFASLEGISELVQSSNIHALVETLNMLIEVSDKAAVIFHGSLNKVIENTTMLIFRGKNSQGDHSLRACKAALKIAKDLSLKNHLTKISISTGIVVSGRIGDANEMLDFTVIGDTVNLAARLKSFSIENPETNIIISPSTIRSIKGQARLRFIKKVPIKGKSRDYPIYELLGLRDLSGNQGINSS
ncbi:MAG: hypothetical protein Kow0029_11090 [Candidatus Rifleibacteriota bacterium]